jgi:hypothetical protein
MMKLSYSISLSLFSFATLVSCSKNVQTSQSRSSKDVYILGAQDINFPMIPTYWKNGSPVLLSDSNLDPESIVVSGADVYVGGWDRGAISVYYKNNIRNVFEGQIFPNAIMGLTVSGEDVYMTGVGDALGNVAYWKNGDSVVIDWALGTNGHAQSSGTAIASAIAVSGNDIYAIGQITDTILNFNSFVPIAAYWKNGKINSLGPSAVFAQPTGIAVSGSDVYISANKWGDINMIGVIGWVSSDTAMYWANGAPVILGTGYTSSIFVSNGDVYVSGTTLDGSAIYWKNGNPVILAANANTKGIVVSGNDVYVAGNLSYHYGVYWKNGVVDTLCNNGLITAITLGN